MQQVVSRQDRLAELVTKLHERNGGSLRGFARDLGVSHTAVGFWKKGQGKLDEASLSAIANMAGSTRDQLALYLEGKITLIEYLEGKSQVIPLPLVEQSLKSYSPQELNQLLKAIADTITVYAYSSSDNNENSPVVFVKRDNDFLPPLTLKGGKRLKNLVLTESRRRGWEQTDFIGAGCDPELYNAIMAEDWFQRYPASELIETLIALLPRVGKWENDIPILEEGHYRQAQELWAVLLEDGNGVLESCKS